jgi:hypothetical protein
VKVEFLTSLDVRKLAGVHWRLLAPFAADVDGILLRVPAGFVTDFASVPRLPLAYLFAGNRGHRAAVLHDYLYSGGDFAGARDPGAVTAARSVTRACADEVFRAALETEGVGGFTRALMWAGVRVGGAGAFSDA